MTSRTPTPPRAARVLVALAGLTLVACHRPTGGASDGGVDAAGGPLAAGAASCALLSKSEAESLFGEPMQEPLPTGNGLCQYRRVADLGHRSTLPFVGVRLYPGESAGAFEEEARQAAVVQHASLVPIPGLGEVAYEIGAFQILALAHGKAVSVTHLQPVDRAKFEAFARAAVAKL